MPCVDRYAMSRVGREIPLDLGLSTKVDNASPHCTSPTQVSRPRFRSLNLAGPFFFHGHGVPRLFCEVPCDLWLHTPPRFTLPTCHERRHPPPSADGPASPHDDCFVFLKGFSWQKRLLHPCLVHTFAIGASKIPQRIARRESEVQHTTMHHETRVTWIPLSCGNRRECLDPESIRDQSVRGTASIRGTWSIITLWSIRGPERRGVGRSEHLASAVDRRAGASSDLLRGAARPPFPSPGPLLSQPHPFVFLGNDS